MQQRYDRVVRCACTITYLLAEFAATDAMGLAILAMIHRLRAQRIMRMTPVLP